MNDMNNEVNNLMDGMNPINERELALAAGGQAQWGTETLERCIEEMNAWMSHHPNATMQEIMERFTGIIDCADLTDEERRIAEQYLESMMQM